MLTHQPTRFGAKPGRVVGSPAPNTAKQGLQTAQANMQQIRTINVNDTPLNHDTAMSRGMNKLRKAGWPVVAFWSSFIPLIGGGISYKAYNEAQPPSVVLQRDAQLGPVWRGSKDFAGLAQLLREAESRGFRQTDVQALEQGLQSLVFMTVETMAKVPARDVDARMLRSIRDAVNISGDSGSIETVVGNLTTDLEGALVSAGLTSNPAPALVNRLTPAIAEFVNNDPRLAQLNAARRGEMVDSIKKHLMDNRAQIDVRNSFGRQFRGMFTSYLQSSGTSIDWARFFQQNKGTAHTREGAIKLFEQRISNARVYSSLSQQERQALLENGREMLQSLDPKLPPAMWGVASGLAILIGLAGIGGVAVFRRKEVLEAAGAYGDIKQGLANPTLFINNLDRSGNVEGVTRANELNKKIDENAAKLAAALKATYDGDPMAKEFMGDASALPDAAYIRQRYTYETAQEMLARQSTTDKLKQTPVTQLAFYEKLNAKMETAALLGNIYGVNLAEIAKAKPADDAKMDNLKLFEANRHWVDLMIAASTKTYCNAAVGAAIAKAALEEAETRRKGLEDRIVELGESSEATALVPLFERAERDAAFRQTVSNDAALRLHDAEKTLDEYIQPLRDFRERLTQAILDQNATRTLEDIKVLRDGSGQPKQDARLKKALDDQTIEKFLKQQEESQRQSEAKIREELAAMLKAKKEKAAAQNTAAANAS